MPKRPFKYHYTKVSLHKHLDAVKSRLEADVLPYVKLVQRRAKGEEGIGNFALIRMLAPVIETVAGALDLSPQEVLEKLKVPYPHLYWSLFRDVFMHADEFELAYYQEGEDYFKVAPGIGTDYPGNFGQHTASKKYVILVVTKLYYDLVSFINTQIESTPDKTIEVKTGIEYLPVSNKPKSKIVREVKRITEEIKSLANTS